MRSTHAPTAHRLGYPARQLAVPDASHSRYHHALLA